MASITTSRRAAPHSRARCVQPWTSIEEFRVTTVGDNADQGRSSGGQVTLITKSGTNTLHGSAYEQYRPTFTAANDWFNKEAQLQAGLPNVPGKVVRNTFGGSIGGPIKKDRLFYFATYEGQRQAENQQVTRNVPSANLQDGVVLYPCEDVTQCPGGTVNGFTKAWTVPSGQFGVGPSQIAQMDPNCSHPSQGFPNGTCPNGNGVNNLVSNAQGTGLFQQYPTPNSSGCSDFDGFNISCFTFSAPNPKSLNTIIAKVDYNITSSGSQRLFVRANYQWDDTAQPPQFPGMPANNTVKDDSRAIAAGYIAQLKPSLINSFRFGLTRQVQENIGVENGPLVTFRYLDDLHPGVSSLSPSTSYSGIFRIPVYNWVDDVTWTKGKHTIQFGTNIRYITNSRASDISNINYASTNPNWLSEGAAGSGGSLDPAAFGFPSVDPNNSNPYNYSIINLVGLIPEVVGQYNRTAKNVQIPQNTQVPKNFRSWESDFYIQDSWHIRPTLTIIAGLRYSLLQPIFETSGNQVSADSSLNQFVTNRADAMRIGQTFDETISYSPSGKVNGKAPFWPWDYKDLGPRLAFAYSPRSDRRPDEVVVWRCGQIVHPRWLRHRLRPLRNFARGHLRSERLLRPQYRCGKSGRRSDHRWQRALFRRGHHSHFEPRRIAAQSRANGTLSVHAPSQHVGQSTATDHLRLR